jgi:hypothetical protein
MAAITHIGCGINGQTRSLRQAKRRRERIVRDIRWKTAQFFATQFAYVYNLLLGGSATIRAFGLVARFFRDIPHEF